MFTGMFNKKTRILVFNNKQAYFKQAYLKNALLKKRMLALIIFTSMLVNGFALSTAEIGKHSLIMITAGAAQNVISSVIGKCNESLAEVTNKVYKYVGMLLFGDNREEGMGADKEGKERKERGENNTTAAIIESPQKESKKIIKESEDAEGIVISNRYFAAKEKGKRKGVLREKYGVMVLFLVFIVAIIRRKEIDGEIGEINIKTIERTRISA